MKNMSAADHQIGTYQFLKTVLRKALFLWGAVTILLASSVTAFANSNTIPMWRKVKSDYVVREFLTVVLIFCAVTVLVELVLQKYSAAFEYDKHNIKVINVTNLMSYLVRFIVSWLVSLIGVTAPIFMGMNVLCAIVLLVVKIILYARLLSPCKTVSAVNFSLFSTLLSIVFGFLVCLAISALTRVF